MTFIHPRPLSSGSPVALISPAGPVKTPEVVDQCRAALEALGLQVHVGANAAKGFDYLAGTDDERAADLQWALTDPKFQGVFCTRGGYSSGRLLRRLDYAAIRKHPRVFAGFSDITAVHAAINKQSGLVTCHSATINSALVSPDDRLTPEGLAAFKKQLFTTEPVGSVRTAMCWNNAWKIRGGKASGLLFGGNASVLVANIGTPYLPDPAGTILFLEDTGEEPYRLDRYINQLEMSGYLGKVAGLILGQFTDADPKNPKRETIDTVFPRILSHLPIPILGNFPAGHVPHNVALPFGARVELDADGGDVILAEALCRN